MNRDSFIKSLIPIRSLGPNMNGVYHINKKQNFKELLGFLKAGRKCILLSLRSKSIQITLQALK